jgi:hypothetical protein
MVWVSIRRCRCGGLACRKLKRLPQLEMRSVFDPSALVKRYTKQGIIKGPILYQADSSRRNQ